MAIKELPKYGKPPLDEVVFGVTFEPLHQFKTPYIGLFWDRIRGDFARCEQAPIIGNIDEIIEPQLGYPTPRVWLINDSDDHLVQLQKNKFFFNWRKRKTYYPSYEIVHAGFLKYLNIFKSFIAEYNLGDLNISSYELSYFNNIPQSDGWKRLNSVESVFPDLSWRQNEDRFLKDITSLMWRTVVDLPENFGNIMILLQSALRKPDNHPLLRLELTVRGFNVDTSSQGMERWFNTAHEWIVYSFEDITDKDVQRKVWRKHDEFTSK